MQLIIENKGKALISLIRARTLMSTRYNELASCRNCNADIRNSYKDGVEFFNSLIRQIQEDQDGQG